MEESRQAALRDIATGKAAFDARLQWFDKWQKMKMQAERNFQDAEHFLDCLHRAQADLKLKDAEIAQLKEEQRSRRKRRPRMGMTLNYALNRMH